MNLIELKCDVCDKHVGWITLFYKDMERVYCSKDHAGMEDNT